MESEQNLYFNNTLSYVNFFFLYNVIFLYIFRIGLEISSLKFFLKITKIINFLVFNQYIRCQMYGTIFSEYK